MLFLIIAEHSLIKRKQRLDELEAQIEEASRSIPKHLFGNSCPQKRILERTLATKKKHQLKLGIIFGLKLPAPSDENDDWKQEANPFINFILDLTRELPKDAVDFIETYDGDENR